MAKNRFDLSRAKANTDRQTGSIRLADVEERARGDLLKAEQERSAAIAASASVAEIPVADITTRRSGDTRPLRPDHVLDLAESIHALGLSQPIAVDRGHMLLAGAHRHAAIRLLSASNDERRKMFESLCGPVTSDLDDQMRVVSALPRWTGLVPVRVYSDLDAAADPERALQIEIVENEKRRDYSRAEVILLARRLRESGYSFSANRPKAGERPGIKQLALIVGKHRSTIHRLLADVPAAPRRSGGYAKLSVLINKIDAIEELTALRAAIGDRLAFLAAKQPQAVGGTGTSGASVT